MEKKKISPVPRQIILRKLGMFASGYYGNDIYFFKEAIDLLIKDIGEKTLIEHYGEDWKKVNRKLKKVGEILSKIKPVYDLIEDKKFKKIEKDKERKEEFFKEFRKLSLMTDVLYDVFFVLLNKSTLQYLTMPNDVFKLVDTELKVIKLKQEHPTEEKKEEK